MKIQFGKLRQWFVKFPDMQDVKLMENCAFAALSRFNDTKNLNC